VCGDKTAVVMWAPNLSGNLGGPGPNRGKRREKGILKAPKSWERPEIDALPRLMGIWDLTKIQKTQTSKI